MKLFRKGISLFGSALLVAAAGLGLASCGNNGKLGDEAITRLSLLLDEKTETSLSSDLSVPYSISVKDKDYVVEYKTNNTNAEVKVDEENTTTTIAITQTAEEQTFDLTATVLKKTKTWSFKIDKKDLSMRKTQAEIDAMNPVNHATFAAAASGTKVVVQGWVVFATGYSASYGNTSVFLQDEDGGYYGYRVKVGSQADYDEYFAVGKKMAIDGTVSPYNKWVEIAAGGTYYAITDAPEKTDFDYQDLTTLWSSNAAGSVEAIAPQSTLAKVTGKVTSIPTFSATASNASLGIKVGGNDYKVYMDKSNGFVPELEDLSQTLKIGYTITVSGLVGVYNTAQLYLLTKPTDSIKVDSTVVTPEDMVAGTESELKAMTFGTVSNNVNYVYDSWTAPQELPTTLNECTITYALSDENNNGGTGAITLSDDHKLNVVVDYANVATAKLTATISHSGTTETKTVTWTITTKTDADVMNELKKAVSGQTLVTSLDASTKGTIHTLVGVVSPSKSAASVTYTLPENDYISLAKTASTQQYYYKVNKVEADLHSATLTATITYKELTETVTWTLSTKESFVITFDDYLAAANNAQLAGSFKGVTSVVGTGFAIVWSESGSVYVYKKNNAITQADWEKTFVVGYETTISNFQKAIYSGLHEANITSLEDQVVKGKKVTAPTPTDITAKISGGTALEAKDQANYITITGVVKGTWAANKSSGMFLTVGTVDVVVYFKSATGFDIPVEGQNVTITGFVNWYNKAQITPLAITVNS